MKPNVVFVFADQWRGEATGFGGNPAVRTPNLDRLAAESLNFTNATSGFPVCTPYRACFLTGQYPHTHGLFLNDAHLEPNGNGIGDAFARGGYDTAYIGKWHVNGRGRSSPIRKQFRQGFEYWKVLECTHDYNDSAYYDGTSDRKLVWDGYDADAQTDDAIRYICEHDNTRPFFLVLSWGPPHNPYETAPESFRDMYRPSEVALRPNVPRECETKAREELAGYYAHCSALDACAGRLLAALDTKGIADDTIFVFTSDHGDMLWSHGLERKQKPWDESVRVPFLLRYPRAFGRTGRAIGDLFIDSPDIMPTLLGLSDVPIPPTVEGLDYSDHIVRDTRPEEPCAVLACYHPFGEWPRGARGGVFGLTGREYRGVRTQRYTYVRTLDGPWLLYDNAVDPYQLTNVIEHPAYAETRLYLDDLLSRRLAARGDEFLPGTVYVDRFGYELDATGTIPYTL